MTDRAASPRRRHILSSINRDPENLEPRRPRKVKRESSPSPDRGRTPSAEGDATRPAKAEDSTVEDIMRHAKKEKLQDSEATREQRSGGDATAPDGDDPLRPRSKKFRFKSKKRSSRRDRDERESHHRHARSRSRSRSPSPSSHHHHHHHGHRSHRRRKHRQKSRSPTPPNPHEPAPLSPDAAFRESLFDAMADDEGAAYWEGVYGQPIHVYTNETTGPQGELERMTEEEYAAHVRQRMWEKTHEGLLEERARREEAKKRQAEAKRAADKEERRRDKVRQEVEDSLRKGEERRVKREWRNRWNRYAQAWAEWEGSGKLEDGDAGGAAQGGRDAGKLPWPVESGKRADVADQKEVRKFFILGLDAADMGEKEFASLLKDERVRWHPDKIQQRVAGGRVDPDVMQDVTAVFQAIDSLWSENRKAGR